MMSYPYIGQQKTYGTMVGIPEHRQCMVHIRFPSMPVRLPTPELYSITYTTDCVCFVSHPVRGSTSDLCTVIICAH